MTASVGELTGLQNPIWTALTSAHSGMAERLGLAARYERGVSSLVGMQDGSAQAFADLRAIVDTGETVALFTTVALNVPRDWKIFESRFIDQMICERTIARGQDDPPLVLTDKDVPEMLALTAATEPGPFYERTIRMGHYVGIRAPDGRLAAMTGQRLRADEFVEVSAVCTYPEFRGRGFARRLVGHVVNRIQAEGKLAILHVKTENPAKSVYEAIGFRVSRPIQLTVITAA